MQHFRQIAPRVYTLVLFIIIVVHVRSKTSISINKYMQKAGEPKCDAGFLKHYSQLNCSCYSYPSSSMPRLQWLQFFRVHIYGISTTFTPGTVILFRSVPFHNCSAELFHSAFTLYTLIVPINLRNTKICTFPKVRDLHNYLIRVYNNFHAC